MVDFNIELILVPGLILVLLSCIAIVAWIYRPNRSKIYDIYSKIPFKDNETNR